jgi:hypothetical protein
MSYFQQTQVSERDRFHESYGLQMLHKQALAICFAEQFNGPVYVQHRVVRYWQIMSWKGLGKKQLGPNKIPSGHLLGGTEEDHEKSVTRHL